MPKIVDAISRMREDGVEDFTIVEIRKYGVGKRVPGCNISTALASRPLQRRYAFQRDGWRDDIDGNGMMRPLRKYVLLKEMSQLESGGVWCWLAKRYCHFACKFGGVPKPSTYKQYCLERCEGIVDGPFVGADGKRRMFGRHTRGQRTIYLKIWRERYGDQDVKDAGKVPG